MFLLVLRSWGGGGGSTWYDEVLNSWRESGIIPVVSIGNSGPRCDTAGSPGNYYLKFNTKIRKMGPLKKARQI